MRIDPYRTATIFVSMLLSAALLPTAVRADEGGSWVGIRIMIKKPGVRIGHSDDAGKQIYLAELTDLVYTVLREEDTWLNVRHRGVEGWFDVEQAVPLEDAL